VRASTTAKIKDDPEEENMTAEETRQLRELQVWPYDWMIDMTRLMAYSSG
jgi:hypothetical protein